MITENKIKFEKVMTLVLTSDARNPGDLFKVGDYGFYENKTGPSVLYCFLGGIEEGIDFMSSRIK